MSHTHVYQHPDGTAFGAHHAKAAGRTPFDRGDAVARGLHPDEVASLAEHAELMADLDMESGTEVEHVDTDETNGHLIVAWTDKTGTPRRTAIEPQFFAGHFQPVTPGQGD